MTEAEGLLESLHERGDLYELTLIRASLDLRRGAVPRSEVPKRGRLLANLTAWCPLQQLIVAEYDSRYATGPGGGSAMWQSCLRRLNSVSWSSPNGDGGTPTLSIDGKEATLLRGLAMVMLGRVPDLPEGLPSQGQWAWLPMIRLAGRYLLSSPRHALGCDPVPATDLPAPSIIDERHADLIRLALNQAAGNIKASAKLLNRFCDFTNEEFFAIDLLRFRQYRLEDRNQEARDLYRDMLAWTRGNRQSPLLEILIEEYAS